MRIFYAFLTLTSLTACVSEFPPRAASKSQVNAELCEHFRGEDPYDAQRARMIDENIELYCE